LVTTYASRVPINQIKMNHTFENKGADTTTVQHGLLTTIRMMSTKDIKDRLNTMDEQPNGTWTHKDVLIESYLISELFNRWEHDWVEMYNGETE